jgi:DNA-binding HxlR family transcriptional regulator
MSAWSVALVRAVADGPLVYHSLLSRLDGISPRVLDGLTSAGRGLLPVLD